MAAASGNNAPPSSPTSESVKGPFDCVKKLTHAQVKRGWREGFSTTEHRSYYMYYNIFTRESVWSIPTILLQQEESEVDSGPAEDLLAAAMTELTGNPPTDLSKPPFIKGKPTKRKFSPDPDQQENEKNAVRFEIGGSSNQDIIDRRVRVRTLTKRILTKLITDEILQLVYHTQKRLGCEGCKKDWPSLFEHACTFLVGIPQITSTTIYLCTLRRCWLRWTRNEYDQYF
ncbi:uncharacterized protein LOC119733319 [Patiria miniata]|uniref:WW domain-containing protein n=1 Tax=Patiria miniata TaxID=46514 RepID=A0A914AH46_PATMI|nr:uncharacterized protein LOC119733319 [Patiria miniata]